MQEPNIILYQTEDGKAAVSLYARDGSVWMNQAQLAELFATSKQNISLHIINVLKDKELRAESVIKEYLTTAASTPSTAYASSFWKAKDRGGISVVKNYLTTAAEALEAKVKERGGRK